MRKRSVYVRIRAYTLFSRTWFSIIIKEFHTRPLPNGLKLKLLNIKHKVSRALLEISQIKIQTSSWCMAWMLELQSMKMTVKYSQMSPNLKLLCKWTTKLKKAIYRNVRKKEVSCNDCLRLWPYLLRNQRARKFTWSIHFRTQGRYYVMDEIS